MGCGSFSSSSFEKYSVSNGRSYDSTTGRVTGQTYTAYYIDDKMKPYNRQKMSIIRFFVVIKEFLSI